MALKKFRLREGRVVEAEEADAPILVFVAPDDTEKRVLVDEYHVDEHTLLSALDPDELSRMEYEPDHVAIIFKRPRTYTEKDQFLFRVTSMGLFIFKQRLIIVTPEGIAPFDGKPFVRVNTLEDVLLKLLFRTIYHFLEHLKVINAISDSLEHKVNASMENRHLINLFVLEKGLVYYLNAINSNGVVIHKIKHSGNRFTLSEESQEFVDDLIIENTQCFRQAEIYSNILASLMDARASIVSNNLNILMKTLTLITVALMVPTLVVSAFSMNVPIPLPHTQLTFWLILGLATLSSLGFVLYWRLGKH